MANFTPVVKAASRVLIHTPGLTRYGSKPAREIAADPTRLAELNGKLRQFADAQAYLPNQVFVGQQSPERLLEVSRPWFGRQTSLFEERQSFGSIIDENLFLALLAVADPFKHFFLLDGFWQETAPFLQRSGVCSALASSTPNLLDASGLEGKLSQAGLPLFIGTDPQPVGWIDDGHHEDE